MEKLIFVPQLTIPLPTNEEEIKNKYYLRNNVTEKKKYINIYCFWKDIVEDPKIRFILTIIDDSFLYSGIKRKNILDPNIKYIGINSTKIGKYFSCYILLSEKLEKD